MFVWLPRHRRHQSGYGAGRRGEREKETGSRVSWQSREGVVHKGAAATGSTVGDAELQLLAA